jgi:hypothetical protein
MKRRCVVDDSTACEPIARYGARRLQSAERLRGRGRISHACNIVSVATRDRHSRRRAVREAETAQVAVTAGQDAARAEKVTVLIKRCRTVLMERCC